MNNKEIACKKAQEVMIMLNITPYGWYADQSIKIEPISEEQFGRFNFNYVFECKAGMVLHVLVNTTKDYVWWQLLAR